MSRSDRPRRRLLVVVAGLGMLGVLVAGALWLRGDDAPGTSAAGTPAVSSPAEEGTTASPTAPRATTPGDGVATDEPVPAAGGEVHVVITQAGWATSGTAAEVSGFVAGVVEDGGTCRVTLTRGDETVTAERTALADATTTACGAIEVGDLEMASGWWDAVLAYESPTSAGASEPVAVLVPTR